MGDNDPLMQFIGVTEAEPDVAAKFLEKCGWDVQEAIQQYLENPTRYLVSDDGGPSIPSDDSVRAPIAPTRMVLQDQYMEEDYPPVRRLPVRRPTAIFEQFADLRAETQLRTQGGAKKSAGKMDRLAELFRPPFDLMFQGDFEDAKRMAERKEMWLLINIQDDTEFDSQRLNRDVWKDSQVKEIVKKNFIFWQARRPTDHAAYYLSIYPVDKLPYVSIIDPRTGELLWLQEGFVDAKTMAALRTLRCLVEIDQSKMSEPNSFANTFGNAVRKFLRMNSFDGDRSDVDFDLTSSGSRRNKTRGKSAGAIFIDDDDDEGGDADFQPEKLPPTRQSSNVVDGDAKKKDVRHMSEEEMLEAAIRASLEDDTPAPRASNVEIESSDEDDEVELEEDDQERLNESKKRKSDVLSTPEQPSVEESNAKRPKIDDSAASDDTNRFPMPQAEDPSRGSKDCTIQIRLPTGSTLTKQFYSSDFVGSVAYVVRHEAGITKTIHLSTMFPKRKFSDDELNTLTLAQASTFLCVRSFRNGQPKFLRVLYLCVPGLTPRAVLIVEVDG